MAQPRDAKSSNGELNYFTCTLDQAAKLNETRPNPFPTIIHLLDKQALDLGHRPAVGLPYRESNGAWTWEVLTFQELKDLSIQAGLLIEQRLPERRVVALLCPSTELFLLSWLGLIYLGYSVLLIEPNIQPLAMANLCKDCGVAALIYDCTEKSIEGSANVAEDQCAKMNWPLNLVPVPKYEDIRAKPINMSISRRTWPITQESIAYFHHTSGSSSGHPKPIQISHRAAVGLLHAFLDNIDDPTFTTTPLYHGGPADCFRAWTSGAMTWLYPGRCNEPITPSNIMAAFQNGLIRHSRPITRYFTCVPFILEQIMDHEGGLDFLKRMTLVGTGGAALSKKVGDSLVKEGVSLLSRYGSAECGFLMSSHRNYEVDQEWQYLRKSDSSSLNFEVHDDGLAELVAPPTWPLLAKRNRDDDSYATADIFESHPRIFNAWKYHSRADAQLTLISGKKFDPTPLEKEIENEDSVQEAMIFGNGRLYPGVLLFRSEKAFNMSHERFLELVWPAIDKLNAESPTHARLARHMLAVMPTKSEGLKKYRASKGTLKRPQAEATYCDFITQAYDGQAKHGAPVDAEAIEPTVSTIVSEILNNGKTLSLEADFFECGLKSIQMVQITSQLQSMVIRDAEPRIPQSAVSEYCTISRLSEFLKRLSRGDAVERKDQEVIMTGLVEKYGRAFLDSQLQRNHNNSPQKATVILTGATGSLGAHILGVLKTSPSVQKIHCLVRAENCKVASERVRKALEARRIPPVDPKAPVTVYFHTVKFHQRDLGLTSDAYAELAQSATVIIHAAWMVNFSMHLSRFVKDHISGLSNLIELANSSPKDRPPTFVFCSSTASVLGANGPIHVDESIYHDPSVASPLGYSQSKWVAEGICERAHFNTRLRGNICVLRIGQLCGDTHGIWNVSEAWPMLLSSVKLTGCLPDLGNEKLDWLRVDLAAAAVVQIAFSMIRKSREVVESHHAGASRANGNDSGFATPETNGIDEKDPCPVFHVVNNDKTVTWADLKSWVQEIGSVQAQAFKISPPSEWLDRLEKCSAEGGRHKSMNLISLWRDAHCGTATKEKRDVTFDMEKTKKVAPVLAETHPVTRELFWKIWKWVEENEGDFMEKNGSQTSQLSSSEVP